jgi:hypothetical protein
MTDKPIAWGMPRPDGLILDVICPEEHAREPGQYTVPLYAAPQPKAEPSNKGSEMSITDDHGQAIRKQYTIIEQRGKWALLYDQHQIGNTVHHEFRIQKLQHDIALYPGITLAEAQKRFAEKVEADDEQ